MLVVPSSCSLSMTILRPRTMQWRLLQPCPGECAGSRSHPQQMPQNILSSANVIAASSLQSSPSYLSGNLLSIIARA